MNNNPLFVVVFPRSPGMTCYLAEGDGDPPRTYSRSAAREFKSKKAALLAIEKAKKTSPFQERRMEVLQER